MSATLFRTSTAARSATRPDHPTHRAARGRPAEAGYPGPDCAAAADQLPWGRPRQPHSILGEPGTEQAGWWGRARGEGQGSSPGLFYELGV